MATLTINGVVQPIRGGTLRILESVNARNTMGFEVVSYNGTYRPPNGTELLYIDGATRRFGGLVDLPTERGLVSQMGTPIVNGVNAVDFNAYADRRHIINAFVAAGTLKAALQWIITWYLGDFTVTLDPAQVEGPLVPALYIPGARSVRDVLDDLSVMTGYVWEIDYHRVLRMVEPGTLAAPFNIAPNSDPLVIDGDITVETLRTEYANRIILLAGEGIRDAAQSFTGDGSTREFPLLVAVSGGAPAITVNGVPVTVGTHGVDTAHAWTFRYLDNTIVQLAEAPPGTAHSPLTGADTLTATYPGQFPFGVFANDTAAQATRGVWEKVITEPAVFDRDMAQALADGYLPRYATVFRAVRYATRRHGLHPMQAQTITVPQRDLSGTFLITDVEYSDAANQFRAVVTAVGGSVYPGSWRDFFRRGGSGGVPSASAGGSGGGGGSQIVLSAPAFLGGDRNESVAITPAAWLPIRDYEPFYAQGTFAGMVRADIWARVAGASVTLRLYNYDGTVTATSVPVTSTTPVAVTFAVGIVIGKTYRLEILSSVAGVGGFAIGSLYNA